MKSSLTTTEILAASTELLGSAGYSRINQNKISNWPVSSRRVFEDQYGIAAIVVFESWEELATGWPDAQGALVELISKNVARSEAKAWDGYLVLFTPGVLPSRQREQWMDIRYDTSRVRKLLATGEELRNLDDVRRTLLPLLPLSADVSLSDSPSALELLPSLFLKQHKISEQYTRAVIDAFHARENLVASLHRQRTGGR